MTDLVDSGLVAYAMLLGIHRIPADPAQLRHGLGHFDAVTGEELVRIARRQGGLRGKTLTADWAKLQRLPLPALANGLDGIVRPMWQAGRGGDSGRG